MDVVAVDRVALALPDELVALAQLRVSMAIRERGAGNGYPSGASVVARRAGIGYLARRLTHECQRLVRIDLQRVADVLALEAARKKRLRIRNKHSRRSRAHRRGFEYRLSFAAPIATATITADTSSCRSSTAGGASIG